MITINDKLIDAFLQNAGKENLIRGIKQIFNHFKLDSEYRYEQIFNNIINIIGGDKLTTINDINIELIKANINKITYESEKINKDSIKLVAVDNITNTVKIMYKREGNDYTTNTMTEYANYLKKVKEN